MTRGKIQTFKLKTIIDVAYFDITKKCLLVSFSINYDYLPFSLYSYGSKWLDSRHFRDFLKVTRNVVVPLTPAPRPIEKATTGMGQGWQIHQLGSQFLNPKSSPHLLSGEENIFVMFILETRYDQPTISRSS